MNIDSLRSRYRLGGTVLPILKEWMEKTFGASLEHKTLPRVSKKLKKTVPSNILILLVTQPFIC